MPPGRFGSAAVAAPVEAPGPADAGFRLPFHMFCLYTFVLIGRPMDYVAALVPLRLGLTFTLLTVGLTLLSPEKGKRGLFSHRETRLYLFFYAAMLAGIPFSLYRPGSFDVVVMRYVVNVAYFLLFLIHIDTLPKLRRIGTVIVLSGCLFTFFSLRMGNFSGGRFDTGLLMFDPNDMAFVAVSLVGFALWVLVGSFGVVMKGLALFVVFFGILLTLYTASRGGMLGLITFLACFLWLKVPKIGASFKTGLVAALLVGAVLNADKINTERYMTLLSLEGDYNMEEGGRKDIWQRGFQLFLNRPITGVGVDAFSAAIGTMRRDEGVQAKWQAAHSSYILVLTETGLAGTVPFAMLIVGCLTTFNRLRRNASLYSEPDFAVLPGVLLAGFAAQLVAAAFLSQTYSLFFTLAFALTAALKSIARTIEITPAAAEAAASPVVPAAVAPRLRAPVALRR